MTQAVAFTHPQCHNLDSKSHGNFLARGQFKVQRGYGQKQVIHVIYVTLSGATTA